MLSCQFHVHVFRLSSFDAARSMIQNYSQVFENVIRGRAELIFCVFATYVYSDLCLLSMFEMDAFLRRIEQVLNSMEIFTIFFCHFHGYLHSIACTISYLNTIKALATGISPPFSDTLRIHDSPQDMTRPVFSRSPRLGTHGMVLAHRLVSLALIFRHEVERERHDVTLLLNPEEIPSFFSAKGRAGVEWIAVA